LAKLDRLDILSSDYVPAGLLTAAVRIGELWDDMPRGMALAGRNPARSAGLTDRGILSSGARADIIRFSMLGDTPLLQETWSEGRRVF
jgi:alpha-D-ribose 1-methylphosphonate 5-triphosphate diphosphatase